MASLLLSCQPYFPSISFIDTPGFVIEASSNDYIYTLKERIFRKLDKQAQALTTDTKLCLYKVLVDVPFESTPESGIANLKRPDPNAEESRMRSTDLETLLIRSKLSSYWDGQLNEQMVHILVQPKQGNLKRKRTSSDGSDRPVKVPHHLAAIEHLTSLTPSSLLRGIDLQDYVGVGRIIACNRPYEPASYPLELLHRSFGIFRDRAALPPSLSTVEFLRKNQNQMTKVNKSSNTRESEFRVALRELGLHLYGATINFTRTIFDGHSPVCVMPAVIRECKSELGDGAALFQAIAYYGKFLKNAIESPSDYIQFRTCFPSIIITDMGTTFQFYGVAYWNMRVRVDPLLSLEIATHGLDLASNHQFAASIDALIAAVKNIQGHYQALESIATKTNSPSQSPSAIQQASGSTLPLPSLPVSSADIVPNSIYNHKDRHSSEAPLDQITKYHYPETHFHFPFLTSYIQDGQMIPFTYDSQIHSGRFVFHATISSSNAPPNENNIIVKFTTWGYCKDAHEILASLGYAPRLRDCRPLNKRWTFIVMDRSPYIPLLHLVLTAQQKKVITEKIKIVVEALHSAGYVHGDIRPANILVDERTINSKNAVDVGVHLIDFEFAGEVGKVLYPLELNHQYKVRPEGVIGDTPITREHDMDSISILFTSII